jgi:hypothetical protein
MSENYCLPFPRGGTAADGQETPAAGYRPDIAGRVFICKDTVNDTGNMVKLRAVRNGASPLTVSRTLIKFSTTAKQFGIVSGGAATAGTIAKPIDDAYVVGAVIPAHDIFYVVEEGPCSCTSGGVTAAQKAVSAGASGKVVDALAGDPIVGVADAAASDDASILVHVTGGLNGSDAATAAGT